VPADLVDRTVALLSQRCLDVIGLARRAGQAICGFEKVRDALRNARWHRARPATAPTVRKTEALMSCHPGAVHGVNCRRPGTRMLSCGMCRDAAGDDRRIARLAGLRADKVSWNDRK
jgi:hypothetical protein